MNDKGTLHRFIENERKSRLVTLVSTILLIICSLAILFLYFKNKKLLEEKQSLNDSLVTTNSNLRMIEKSLESRQKELNAKDSIIKLLQNKNVKSKEKLENELKIIENTKEKFKIYIHYMPDYEQTSNLIKNRLGKDNAYYVADPEKINKLNFNPQIRYFYDNDLVEANNLKRKLRQELNLNLEVKRIKMVAQKKQIEIWYGKIPTDEQMIKFVHKK